MDIRPIIEGYNNVAQAYNRIAMKYELCNCAVGTQQCIPAVIIDYKNFNTLPVYSPSWPGYDNVSTTAWSELVSSAKKLVEDIDGFTVYRGGPLNSVVSNCSIKLYDTSCADTGNTGTYTGRWGACEDIQDLLINVYNGTVIETNADIIADPDIVNKNIKLLDPGDFYSAEAVLDDYNAKLIALENKPKWVEPLAVSFTYSSSIEYIKYDSSGGYSKSVFSTKASDLYEYVRDALEDYFTDCQTNAAYYFEHNYFPELVVNSSNDPDNMNFEINSGGSVEYQKVTISVTPTIEFTYTGDDHERNIALNYKTPVQEYGTVVYNGNYVEGFWDHLIEENRGGTWVGWLGPAPSTAEDREALFGRLRIVEKSNKQWKSVAVRNIGGRALMLFNPLKTAITAESLYMSKTSNPNLICLDAFDRTKEHPIANETSYATNRCSQYTQCSCAFENKSIPSCSAAFLCKIIPDSPFEAGSRFNTSPRLIHDLFVNRSEWLFDRYIYNDIDTGIDIDYEQGYDNGGPVHSREYNIVCYIPAISS